MVMSTSIRIKQALVALLTACMAAIFAGPAAGAVALDAKTLTVGTNTTFTYSHTVGVGMDRVLLVGVSCYNSAKTVTACTYNGVALTRVGFQDGGGGSNDRRMEIWRLINPPVGTFNVSVTFSSSAKAVIGSASFFGVNQTTPNGTFVSAGASTNLVTLTVPSAAGELVYDCMAVQGNAATATVGSGQTQLWNDYSRSNGGAVVGCSSTEPGAASVVMTWNLSGLDYWVIGAVSLKPAVRPFQPDALVKLSSEAATAYLYDYWYENPASLQVKSASVLATVPATYNVRLDNDGTNSDRLVITGTGSSSSFTVQYLDAGNVDRTAAVTGAGYTTPVMTAGTSVVWTVKVTPLANGTAGGLTYTAKVTATSQGDATKSDQVSTQTTCTAPNLVMTKSVDLANALPGQDIHYSVVANSTGSSNANAIVLVDSIPSYAGFRIGSASFAAGTSGLTSAVSYSRDHGVTWSYTPGTGGCTAPSGYDYCVTHVRWVMTGAMVPSRNFTIGMTVRVK
jgi:uncharacterized repeat protein (TIGR01451 family)